MKHIGFFLTSYLIVALSACTHNSNTILIRVHNASSQEFINLKIAPDADTSNYWVIGAMAPGELTEHFEVSKSRIQPIVDVTCLYAHYLFIPEGSSPPPLNAGGSYTYHVNLIPNDSAFTIEVTQSVDE